MPPFEFQKLPPRSEVGYLDPEIANEGQSVYKDAMGDEVLWSAPAPKPVVPDWSQNKAIKHYFNRSGYAPWPTMIYHPVEASREVKDAEEARKYGIVYREATLDERERFGIKATWDWINGTEWRVKPFPKDLKFDPTKTHAGKEVRIGAPSSVNVQSELVKAIVPEVAAAVVKAMAGHGLGAPADVSSNDWKEFQEFLAWKKSSEALHAIADEAQAEVKAQHSNALAAALNEEDGEPPHTEVPDERVLWETEAERRGIQVDGRWSLKRLKAEIEKSA
jgi:hypothetical protein